jgi:hypothetical protein
LKPLLVALLLFQGSASVPKPGIDHIRAVGDTVWFEGNRGFDSVRIRYCYVPGTGAWCRFPRPTPGRTPDLNVPQSPKDSVVITPGFTLRCRGHAEAGSYCETFGIFTADDRREHWLVPRITAAGREQLLKAIGLETEEPPSMSGSVTAFAATNDAIWLGLGGGFPEGEGAFGGLLRFDRARRTAETIIHPGLASATVTGLAVVGEELWVGTAHPGEFGYAGATGILRRDLRTGDWKTADSATTPLPDNLVQTLGAVAGVVCVATRDGLAVFDPRARRWAVRYFRRTIVRDSTVFALAAVRPPGEPRQF